MSNENLPDSLVEPIKVSAYIDGFNLYYGLKDSNMRRFYWLNIFKLAESFLRDNQILVSVKYFTARISGPIDKQKRQNTFLEAIAAQGGVDIFEGKYRTKNARCQHCRRDSQVPEEKMTDVNIATQMLIDAFAGRFDRAILVSGDSDLVPPVNAVCGPVINREVIVAFPPARTSVDLKKSATNHFQIHSSRLSKCQFDDRITKPDGFVLERPQSWK